MKNKPKRPTGRVKPEGPPMMGTARHLGPRAMRELQKTVDSMRSPNHRRGK